MSLPSGLLFYLDYSYGSMVGGEDTGDGNEELREGASFNKAGVYAKGDSLYGSPSGASVRSGASARGGQYDLAGSSYSRVYKEAAFENSSSGSPTAGTLQGADTSTANSVDSFGAYDSAGSWTSAGALETTNAKNLKLIQYDSQVIREINEGSGKFHIMLIDISGLSDADKTAAKGMGLMRDDGAFATVSANFDNNLDALSTNDPSSPTADAQGEIFQDGKGVFNIRRLNQIGTWNQSTNTWTPSVTGSDLLVVVGNTDGGTAGVGNFASESAASFILTYPKLAAAAAAGAEGVGSTLVIPSFESDFGSDPNPQIPEIDIKIESIAVTAQTRKLRARWSPELAQDLNAYHSLDAEVELTQILSEQIALEIDREILNDLLVEAAGANFFWSRAPGKFVNKRSGTAQNLASTLSTGPQFTGTVREWYETLVETIIDVANEIHRKTLRGSANFIVVSPEVATIFEASVLYKPSIKIDGQGQVSAPFSIGAEAIGSLSNRFTVYKDPYFPRNKVLVGYKGGSYLESGYVYAPYVPLIVTPTIFAPEDFTPRKGVMTRYGKKMVRADFYGTVTCLDMDII